MNPIDLNKIISKNLNKYKKKYNITTYKLSKLTGISYNTLKRIENNKIEREITILELYKLSVVLKVSVNKLLETTYDQ